MLEKWKATCTFNLSNLIRCQQILKDSCTSIDNFVAECFFADNLILYPRELEVGSYWW